MLATMPSRIEAQAQQLVDALYALTAGRPMQYRSIGSVGERARVRDENALKSAIEFGRDRGWLEIVDGHSVCLTDAGRQRAGESTGRARSKP